LAIAMTRTEFDATGFRHAAARAFKHAVPIRMWKLLEGPVLDGLKYRHGMRGATARPTPPASCAARACPALCPAAGACTNRCVGDGDSAFASDVPDEVLSPMSRAYLGGLLAQASAVCAFAVPTINGYRRYRPRSSAPTRASWARDNRGVMVCVLGQSVDPATRLENRAGEPAANPYLTMAAQIAAGLDGVDRGANPGPASVSAYDSDAPPLPRGLADALAALRTIACMADAFGPFSVDYFTRLKEAEIERFLFDVSDWEPTPARALMAQSGWGGWLPPTASECQGGLLLSKPE
jgi:hypothetical protein